MLSCEICQIFKNNFFTEDFQWLLISSTEFCMGNVDICSAFRFPQRYFEKYHVNILEIRLRYFLHVGKNAAQKMKFSIKDFFIKCDQIHKKLQIWWHLQCHIYTNLSRSLNPSTSYVKKMNLPTQKV